jgi:hypothetical protein
MIDLTAVANAGNPFIVAKMLASQGVAVFPVRAKQPLTPNGVYSATSDPAVLLRMNWRNADGVGLPTGEVSEIDVLDVDLRGPDEVRERGRELGLVVDRKGSSFLPHGVVLHGAVRSGFAALAQMPALPETLTAQTPRNGRHFYFRHIAGGRSRKFWDGSVEWFSTGKLVVVPPAPGRSWTTEAEIAEAPAWLREMVLAPRHSRNGHGVERNSSGPLLTGSGGQVPREIYFLILRAMRNAPTQAQRRVQGLWANLAAKHELRNDGLNYTAWQFSQFIERGELDGEKAAKLLWLACEANGYLAKDGADVVKEVINRVLATPDDGQKGD